MKSNRLKFKRLIQSLCLAVFLMATSLGISPESSALSGSGFNPARIIDDAIFFNPNSMSAQDIQNFLNAKVPTCDTNHAKSSSSDDSGPPYTCLKEYSQPTTTIAADSLCNGFTAGTKSAATIIKEVAMSCNINPQVILITLQKEQGLITDVWPWQIQYDKATGYACPDNPPAEWPTGCDPDYVGFFKQVYYGARQFQRYVKQPELFNYRIGQTSTVLWNVNGTTYWNGTAWVACGGTNITIQSRATAALYNYTPYQPNSAALNQLYSAVSPDDNSFDSNCAAYGNRNFWRMFNDWFGTTLADKPIANADWKFENLDGGSDSLNPSPNTTGITPDTVAYDGELYVFYYDASLHVLKAAVAGSSGWTYQTLDGIGTANGRIDASVGSATTSLVYNNTLHVFYYDITNSSMRHGWFTSGGSWNFETLDGTIGSVSGAVANVGMSNTAVEYDGQMHLLYYDGTNANLRHASYSSALGWKFENLDGDYGSISGYNSNVGQNPKAVLMSGSLQLFYYDVSNGNLRHAWVNPGQSWKFENLDGDYGSISGYNSNVGQDPSVVVHYGSLQLFYYDVSNGNLRHAWVNPGQSWKFENLDGDYGSIGRFNSNVGSMTEALSYKNSLYVFYRDNSSGVIRYSWADAAGWHFAPLEGAPYSVSGHISNTGFWPTVTGYGDSLQLYYFDNDQRALRHSFGIPYW